MQVGAGAEEDDVRVPGVVAGEHRAVVRGDVLRADDRDIDLCRAHDASGGADEALVEPLDGLVPVGGYPFVEPGNQEPAVSAHIH